MEQELEASFRRGAYPPRDDVSHHQNVAYTQLEPEMRKVPNLELEPEPLPKPESDLDHPNPEPESLPEPEQEPELRRRGILWQLETTMVLVLVGGTLLVLLCLAFLSFLWFSNESNTAWRNIVTTGWLTRSVTITSLLLRWTVAAQAALTTSMVAALLLDTSETPLAQAAAVSLAVFSNTGPHELLRRLPRGLGSRSLVFWSVILLMTCTTTLLQFASTLLLSDVSSATIDERVHLGMPYAINASVRRFEAIHYMVARPIGFPAFAEYVEPAVQRDGVSDTGLSIRAFLPIYPQTRREATVGYTGAATLLDTRVACMRPIFSDVQANILFGPAWTAGTVWTEQTVPRFTQSTKIDGTLQPAHFNCIFKRQGDGLIAENEWPITICNVEFTSVDYYDVNPGVVSEMNEYPPRQLSQPLQAPTYLVINTTGAYASWVLLANGITIVSMTSQAATVAQGVGSEWTTLKTNVDGPSFSMTLCSLALEVQNTNITATRRFGAPEPSAGWQNPEGTYETQAVRTQFGSMRPIPPHHDRNIFSLAKKDSWLRPPYHPINASNDVMGPDADIVRHAAFRDLPNVIFNPGDLYNSTLQGTDIAMCGFCGHSVSRVHAALFQDTIRETGSAAWAMQGLATSLFGMSYDDHVFQFNVSAPADITTELVVLEPTSWRFFAAVVVMLSLHLCLIALVLALFLWRPECGRLGGSWAAVARVSGPATDGWLAVASTATDAEVSKRIAEAGQGSVSVGLERFGKQVRLRQKPGISEAMIK